MSKVTFIPDETSIKDPKLVKDILDRIENCLDKGGSSEFLMSLRDSIRKYNSYTPNQMWRVQKVEDDLDRNEDTFFGTRENELHGDQ
jgi:hypothetical protein